jgi:tail sheath protein
VPSPRLEELAGLENGYELRVSSAIQLKQAEVLCIECLDGEELLFPVDSISQQAGNNGGAAAQGDYVLTSHSPTWKLTPTLVEHLTPDGWVALPVLLPARRLEVRMARNDREYSLHLEAEDASKIQIGDVLRVTVVHGGQLLFPVSDVQIPPEPAGASSATSESSLFSSQASSSPEALDAQVISEQALWIFTPPSSPGASYSSSFGSSRAAASPAASPASSPSLQCSYGALLQVDRLSFNLYVREGETIVETWNDLRFGPLTASPTAMQNGVQGQANALSARAWLDVLVPSADELRKEIAHPGVVQRDIPGLDPARSALLGVPNSQSTADNGTAVAPLYFPLCMDDLPLQDEFAGPLDATSAFVLSSDGTNTYSGGTDDLETFEPESLFLDDRLAGVGYRDLVNEANAILFASPDVEVDPFLGLHSLLFIDEIGIVALPDLPQRGWARRDPQEDKPVATVPVTHAKRDWSQFEACHRPRQPHKPPEVKPVVEPVLDLPFIETPDEYKPEELGALMKVQHALVNFCAARADVLGVMGLPLHFKKREVLDWQQRFTSAPDFMDGVPLSYVAVYHPWLEVYEEVPLQAVVSYRVPPDGAVCGMIAARELARGPWIAPANVPLLSVIGLSPALMKGDWEALFNAQVNLVRQLPGQFTLMSAHTLSLEDTFLQISVRRLLIFLRKLALLRGMRYVFEANNERFRERVQSDFEAALTIMAQRGAISAFEVITDSSVNMQNDYDNGRFIIAIRVAPTLPIEFITVVLLRSGEDLLQVIEG